jgi:prolyl-tRNA editing enzyme YbaK/EbsC (Cys-tRNA(Pro) deacylase)
MANPDQEIANPDQKVLDALQKIGIPYELIEIDPNYSDTKAFCERYGYPPEQTCNTILVTSKKGAKMYAACVALANTRLDVNKRVRNLLGVPKVSFASSDEMVELTGMEIGGVTPIGLPAELPLYVDQRIMDQEWVILGGGSREIKVKVSPELFNRIGAKVVSDLAC